MFWELFTQFYTVFSASLLAFVLALLPFLIGKAITELIKAWYLKKKEKKNIEE